MEATVTRPNTETQRPAASRPRVVIVGGGFAGIHAARSLAHIDVDVTVVDRRNHHLFQPLLYQVALAVLSPADIAGPIRSILRHQQNAEVLMDEVDGIDIRARYLTLASGARVSYDYLALATGASHSYFGHEEWAQIAPGLKTVEDALELRRRVLLAFDPEAEGPRFGHEDERLLRSFAANAATAVATAKSVEAERLRHSLEAAEQERKRWARELHDETLQALGGLRMLHSAALREDADATEIREALTQGVELIDTEIDNLSALIAELRPAALDEIGLVPALRPLAERKGREGGLSIEIRAELDGGPERLPAETESILYRLVQEGLNNIVKHAGASQAHAVLQRSGEVLRVSINDDGRGFDTASAGSGFGLTGMRERVELAGGELRIDSAPGRGTTVSASIPLPCENGAHGFSSPRSST